MAGFGFTRFCETVAWGKEWTMRISVSCVRFSRTRLGFTLVELLVVISIIALLLAIMLPSLSRARESARSIVCSTNLRQLNLGMQMYANTNNGQSIATAMGNTDFWFSAIAPYLGNKNYVKNLSSLTDNDPGGMKTLYCPSTRINPLPKSVKITSTYYGTNKMMWVYAGADGSYGMNMFLVNYTLNTTYPQMFGLENCWPRYFDISQPSQVPVFADSVWVGGWPGDRDVAPNTTELNTGIQGYLGFQMARFCIDRHKMTVNVAFADNHGRKVKLSELWSLKWHKNFKQKSFVKVPR